MPQSIITCLRGLLLFDLLIVAGLAAQIKIHHNLTVEDGLVQSQVVSIYEDRLGYLWFGTLDGVSRWDGVNFTNFQPQEGSILRDCLAFGEDGHGTLCFGTSTGLMIQHHGTNNTLDRMNGLASVAIRAIYRDTEGTLFLGTNNGLMVYADGKFENRSENYGLAGKIVTAIAKDDAGTFFFGTHYDGVHVYRNGGMERWDTRSGLAHDNVRAICPDRRGVLYIGTDHGVSTFAEGKLARLRDRNGFLDDQINAIHQSHDGTLYFGTFRHGAIFYKDGEFDQLNKAHGLAANRVFAIYEDGAGTIYLGTDGGVSLYKPGKFETWNEQMGVADNLVWAISQSNDGTLYFGTQSGVSRYHNDKFQTLAEKQGLAHNQVRAVLASKEGKVYFGTGGGGVSVYENGQVRPFGLAGYFVLCIYEHLDGTIYFGTADDGAHAYKKGKWTTLSSKDGLPSDQVFAINGRWDGTIYFGTSNGVSIHKNGQFSMRNEKDGLASNFVWCIFPAKDGSVYFGTNNGLSIYKNEKWKTIDVRRGLSNNTVLGILEDEAGKIYVSTNKGINVLELSPGQARMRTLRYSDGLPSDECVLGACYKDRLGRLWFGTVKGAVRYDPQQDQPRAIPPRAYVTQLRVFNRTIAFDSLATNLIFKHDENYLTFDFVGIDLQARGKLTHRYRMAGLDQDWMEIRQRAVQYANLDDGHYTFEIQARNEWGNWSAPAKIAFTIQPPFWEKWWFVMFVTLALGGGITSLIRLRVRQLLALERLRTRIAADLHDHIGAGLTEISILSEVGAQQINRNPRNGVAGHFGKISEISRGLVERMNDIVWLVNPRRDSLDDLIRQLGSSFAEVSTCSGIIFRAQNLETLGVVRLPMEYRQQLFYIFKEALHNSLKHSAAQEVVLEAHMQGKHLHMRLKDDGKGFDATQVSYRNGLTNMHSRARMIGGSLSVCSAPGEGTVIAFDGKISEEPVEKSTWGSARKGNLKFPPNNASTLLQKLR